jgi:6-phosphofructokinase 1
MARKNAFYAQSGGVSAVINASACGVLQTALQHWEKISKAYAGRNGIIGALTEDLIDTSLESDAAIAALTYTPGAAFGSCRYKLRSIHEHRAQYQCLIEVFRVHDIGFFFYNGGGDSQDTGCKVSRISTDLAYPIVCVGIPKTVDNDLAASMSRTSTKVFALDVMGRHVGWATAACALAAEEDGGAPHVFLLPEITFDEGRFLSKVEQSLQLYDHCVIAVSEGSKDAFDHAQLGGVAPVITDLVSTRLGYRCHWAVRDYLQRSARHIASETDVQQAYAVGRTALELASAGKNAVMPAIRRLNDIPYSWEIIDAPLSEVANREQLVPPNFISTCGFGVTEAGRRYLAPLIVGDSFPPFKNGLPDYVKLRNVAAAKKTDHGVRRLKTKRR